MCKGVEIPKTCSCGSIVVQTQTAIIRYPFIQSAQHTMSHQIPVLMASFFALLRAMAHKATNNTQESGAQRA